MCDTCSRVGARAGARCRHASGDNRGSRRDTARRGSRSSRSSSLGDLVPRPNRTPVHALCGGFVAGVIIGGAVGGIIVGLGAAGAASYVRKRNRERSQRGGERAAAAIEDAPDDAAQAAARVSSRPVNDTPCAGEAQPGPAELSSSSSLSSSMTTEEAMFATGRAIAYGTQVMIATPVADATGAADAAATGSPVDFGTAGGGYGDIAGQGGQGTDTGAQDGSEGGGGGSRGRGVGDAEHGRGGGTDLPSARLVGSDEGPSLAVQAIALPCSSRFLQARGITAVTASPANGDDVVVGRPLQDGNGEDSGGNSANANANGGGGESSSGSRATPAPRAEQDEEEASLLLARICGSGHGGGNLGTTRAEASSRDPVAIPAVVTADAAAQVAGGVLGGGRWAVSTLRYNGTLSSAQADGAPRRGRESSWAGEEFEGDWGSVFEAYCSLDDEAMVDGRLPCLTAREPLQGSGVSGRIARRILRIADWDGDGRLDRDEFVLAMYLCRRHRLGDRVPSRLDWMMVPPRLRELRGCRPSSPCPSVRPPQ